MIELVRDRLDPRVQERWRVALAQKPLVSRLPHRLDLEALALALPLSFAPYLLAFGLWYPDQLPVDLLQGASAALACALLRAAIGIVRRPRWPEGRFLYAWGYAEIARDVLRVVPIDELAIEVRGVALVAGRVRLILRADGLHTTLWLAESELGGLERALEIHGGADAERWTLGYRDSPPRIEGRRVGRRLSPGMREVSWALVAAMVGIGGAHLVWLAVPTRRASSPRPLPRSRPCTRTRTGFVRRSRPRSSVARMSRTSTSTSAADRASAS